MIETETILGFGLIGNKNIAYLLCSYDCSRRSFVGLDICHGSMIGNKIVVVFGLIGTKNIAYF